MSLLTSHKTRLSPKTPPGTAAGLCSVARWRARRGDLVDGPGGGLSGDLDGGPVGGNSGDAVVAKLDALW